MKHLILVILIAAFCTGAAAQEKQPAIDASSVYNQDAVKVVSPNQAGWVLLQSGNSETVFEKRSKDEILNASVKTVKTKTFDNERDLLKSLEAMKDEELQSKYKKDSLHFNYVRFKQTPCIQYDGIFNFKEAATPKFEYFNFKGYLCRHPENKDSVVQMEFSNYSNSRGLSEDLHNLSSEFFEKTAFSKVTVK
ncbi:MAG TPA: hypothetical protein VF721_09135 [Pyrinomonadaceae bacterium]|jgi:hypothetical protein